MKAVILIGGLGTRLYPLTYKVPKALFPIVNIPFLTRLIDWLASNQVTQAIFAMSHLALPLIEFLETYPARADIEITTRLEVKPLGSGGALKNCIDFLDDDFLLLNGDILTDLDLRGLMKAHRERRALVTTSLGFVEDPTHYGILDIRENGRVLDWQEKPSLQEAKSNWANVGAWAMSPEIADFIPDDKFVSLEKETFPLLLDIQAALYGYPFYGYWQDIGTIDKYIQANHDLLSGKIQGAHIPGQLVREGIWVDESAQLAEGVTLRPPIVIGKNCRIASGSEINGPTVIGDDCSIESGVTVASSLIWDGSYLGRDVRLSQSLIATAKIEPDCLIENCVVAPDTLIRKDSHLKGGTILGPGSVY